MKQSAYIITKPLQYINATNIYNESKKELLLVDSFANSKNFIEEVKLKSNFWSGHKFFSNRNQAFVYILKNRRKIDKIYTDSDNGLITRLFLILFFPIQVIVYEEGFGNYRKEIKRENSRIKFIYDFVDFFLGKSYLGGAYRTSKLYLYHKNAFLNLVDSNPKKEIVNFEKKFTEHLLSLKELSNVFTLNKLKIYKGKKVLIYLTARKVDDCYKTHLNSYKEYIKILKPHPEFQNKIGIEEDFDICLNNEISAELIIINLLSSVSDLVILHHGDTTILNLIGVEKIKQINVTNNVEVLERFNSIKNQIFSQFH